MKTEVKKRKSKVLSLGLALLTLMMVMVPVNAEESGENQFSIDPSEANKQFLGTVGQHPLLEAFGDEEGQGVLAATERDIGKHRVFPITSKTTPGRQMAMKLGNFTFNTNRNYPADDLSVSSLVFESKINEKTNGNNAAWNATFMDTTSVGVLSADGNSFTDLNISSISGKAEKPSLRAYSSERTSGFFIGQAVRETDPNIRVNNNENWQWSIMDENGGGTSHGKGSTTKNGVVLMRMYASPDKPYIVAYGAHVEKTIANAGKLQLLGYVRIIMEPVGDEGRVRTTYSYVNLTTHVDRQYSAFYARYGAKLSETKSLGDDQGEYFKSTSYANGGGYAYAMYRDDYPTTPTTPLIGNVSRPIGRVVNAYATNSLFEPGINPVDPGESQSFASGRGLNYIGQKEATPFGVPVSWDIDVQGFNVSTLTVNYIDRETKKPIVAADVSDGLYDRPYEVKEKEFEGYQLAETKTVPENTPLSGIFKGHNIEVTFLYSKVGTVTAKYQDEAGDEIAPDIKVTKPITEKISDHVKAIEIPGFAYSTVTPNINKNFSAAGETVIFKYKEARMKVEQEAFDQEGNNVADEKVDNGQVISYKLTLNSLYKPDNSGITYKEMVLSNKIDDNLVAIKDYTLKTAQGANAGTVEYDKNSQTLTATTTPGFKILRSENLILEFKGTVKEGIFGGTELKVSGSADGSYSDEKVATKKEADAVVSTVKGELKIVSAPLEVDFGTLDMANFRKKVNVVLSDDQTPLVVQDTREKRDKWSLTAQVDDFMTNDTDVRLDALRYVYNGKEEILTKEPKKIYTNDGSGTIYLYNISSSWGIEDMEDGLKFKIDTKKAPIVSNEYKGSILWKLNDTIE